MVYPKNCLIIDIGNEQIKVVETTRVGGLVKVNQFAVIETPEGSINDGIILNKVQLNNALKPILKANKFKSKNIVFTISSSKIITREVDFPDIKSKKLKTVILNSASEYFPVNLNEYILDYVISDAVIVEGEKILKVNLIAAQNSMIQEYVALSDLLDIKLIGIDYTGNSLVNFLKREKLEGNYMVLDIGSSSTMVSIMASNVSKFNRNIMFGTGLLLDCIMNHFEVNSEEAIRISKERPLLTIEQEDNPYLSNDISSAMNQILNGVARLLDYYTSRNQEKIARVYIIGGGANINGIQEYVEKFFNLPTSIIKNFTSVKYNGEKDFTSSQIYLSNAIGASYSEINLLPKTMAEKAEVQSRKRTAYLLVILVAVLLVAFYILQLGKINSLKNQQAQLEQEIADAQVVQVIKAELLELTRRADFRQQIMDTSAGSSERFVAVIETMETQMPSEVFYLNVTDSGTSLEISCVAKDKMTVAKFIETLKTMGFSEVYVPAITEVAAEDEGSTYVTFTVSCKY